MLADSTVESVAGCDGDILIEREDKLLWDNVMEKLCGDQGWRAGEQRTALERFDVSEAAIRAGWQQSMNPAGEGKGGGECGAGGRAQGMPIARM